MKVILSGKEYYSSFFWTEREAILCPPLNCQVKMFLGIGHHGIRVNAHETEGSIITSDEAKSLGVEGWDAVLAEIKGFKAEVTERKIANFWASCRNNRQMAQKVKNRKGAKPNISLDLTAEVAGSTSTTGNDTPNVDANKSKCTDMPNSAEPLTKHTYAGSAALAGSGPVGTFSKPKKMACTLWVHTNDVEKGEISQDYFFEVISRCNVIKVDGFLDGKTEFSWCPDMRGQPTYDSDHSRGKIVCFDLQTFNFWRTYIPIAALQVGDTPCKAWSWEEYKVPKIRYSCLIPIDTCKGLEVRKLIQSHPGHEQSEYGGCAYLPYCICKSHQSKDL